MITAITYQSQHSKKYVHPEMTSFKQLGRTLYGEQTTTELQEFIEGQIEVLNRTKDLLEELNSDLSQTDIANTVYKHFEMQPEIRTITKKKRSYYIAGLTIHEEDQTL